MPGRPTNRIMVGTLSGPEKSLSVLIESGSPSYGLSFSKDLTLKGQNSVLALIIMR